MQGVNSLDSRIREVHLHLMANPAIPVALFQKGCRCRKESLLGLLSCAAFIAAPLGCLQPVFSSTCQRIHHSARPSHPGCGSCADTRFRQTTAARSSGWIAHIFRRGAYQGLAVRRRGIATGRSSSAGSTVAKQPKDRFIVLYCGCCPWNHCPNVGPAFVRLRDLGFSRVKVLYLPNNFGDDWVAKGYPTDRDQ